MFGYLFFNSNDYSFIDNLRISSFNVLSILSGTGYVTDDFGLWGKFPLIFFLFLMFVGGCAGSTTCGIKIFIFSYLFLFLIIAMLLSITGLDFLSAISGAATSISNVGPGLGEMIGPNGDFSEVSDTSKWILSFAMLVGRLEIFAVLVLFLPSFWR